MLSGLWLLSCLVRLTNFLKVMVFEKWYSLVLMMLLTYFILIRCPYVYSILDCGLFLVSLVLPLFISLFFSRLFETFGLFISSLIPAGSPIVIAPFVCIVESVSYAIRPLVLMFRPFVNLSAGIFGAMALGNLCFIISSWIFFLLFILFVYEVFVALMHWFIVQEILKFSVDH